MAVNQAHHSYQSLDEEEKKFTGLYNDAYLRLGMLGIRNVADIGCGAGPFVEVMTARKQRPQVYWGVDSDIRKIEAARRKFPGWKFVLGDVFKDLIINQFFKFDAFLMLNILDRLEDDLGLLASIPAGKQVVLSTPAFEEPGILRKFNSSEEARERYFNLLDISHRGRYVNPLGYKWFMIVGARRP